jgi:hypothetical protein
MIRKLSPRAGQQRRSPAGGLTPAAHNSDTIGVRFGSGN